MGEAKPKQEKILQKSYENVIRFLETGFIIEKKIIDFLVHDFCMKLNRYIISSPVFAIPSRLMRTVLSSIVPPGRCKFTETGNQIRETVLIWSFNVVPRKARIACTVLELILIIQTDTDSYTLTSWFLGIPFVPFVQRRVEFQLQPLR